MSTIVEVWESFIEDETFDRHAIKQEILKSWMRCKEHHVSVKSIDKNNIMSPKEKENYILEYLPIYKNEGCKEFCKIVQHLGLDISIYDADAKLKYIVLDSPVIEEFYPEMGYFKDVSETAIGTNSTCMALLENKPFMVIGSEHYKNLFHNFSCAAAPIYDLHKNMIGTVNASFVHTSVNHDTLHMIYSLARLYEKLVLADRKSDSKPLFPSQLTIAKDSMHGFEQIIGSDPKLEAAKRRAEKATKVDSAVVIYGESGSGKEVFTQAIHFNSKRKEGPFVAINCGAIPKDLIESELFGYESGSFTGAVAKGKKGLLENASGGTLFLDEIESMPMEVQVKLLRAISSSSVVRIGGHKPIPIDIRIISAAKVDLKELIKKKKFREDLYYRINVIEIEVPPLRGRNQDIRLLINHYIKLYEQKNKIQIQQVDPCFYKYLESYHWPGNVRQLQNIVERTIVLSDNHELDIALLPDEIINEYKHKCCAKDIQKTVCECADPSKSLLEQVEAMTIARILEEENHNITKAAERLGISRPTLYNRLKKMN